MGLKQLLKLKIFQGQTVKKGSTLVIHWHQKMDKGMAYVMLGRCENLEDIHIAGDFKPEGIHCSQLALLESQRLEGVFESEQTQEIKMRLMHKKISYLNTRSLCAHLEDINQDLDLIGSDMLGLGETWLAVDQEVQLEGFNGHFASNGNGKGVAAFTKESCSAEVSKVTEEKFSAICVEERDLVVIFLYLSQDFNQQKLFETLTTWMSQRKPTAVLGDVNWNYNLKQHSMKNFMFEHDFCQLIETATHEQGNILDQIWVNSKLQQQGCFTSKESVHFSDHDIITLYIKNRRNRF